MNDLEDKVEKGFLQECWRNTRKFVYPLVFTSSMAFMGISCGGDKRNPLDSSSETEEPIPKKNNPPNTIMTVEVKRDTVFFYNNASDPDGDKIGSMIFCITKYEKGTNFKQVVTASCDTSVQAVGELGKRYGFNGFPPGDYGFSLTAIDEKGLKDPTPEEALFTVGDYAENRIILPDASPFKDDSFDVVNSDSFFRISGANSFDMDLSEVINSEVVVLAQDDRPVLLGYAIEGDQHVEISAKSTYIALAMMNPFFVDVSPEIKREIVNDLLGEVSSNSQINLINSYLLNGRNPLDEIIKPGNPTLGIINDNVAKILQNRANKAASRDKPYIEDIAGNDVKLVNTENIYYSSIIVTIPDSIRRDLFLLMPKKGIFDFDFFPPNLIADPTERIYNLSDGSFSVNMYKGFSGNASEYLNLNHPIGRATIANVALGINTIIKIVNTSYGSDDLDALILALEGVDPKSLGDIGALVESIQNKDWRKAFVGTVDIVNYNREMIASRLAAVNVKRSVVAVAEHLALVVPIAREVVLAAKVGYVLDKIPVFYDLATAPSHVNYRITQKNGILKDYAPSDTTPVNRAPNKPSNPNPVDSTPNISLEGILSWSASDPDGDKLSFDLYFEKDDSTPDVLFKNGLTDPSSNFSGLENNTIYYWRVIANDGKLTTTGDVWKFTTKDKDITPPPITGNFKLPTVFEGYSFVKSDSIDYKALKDDILRNQPEKISPWSLFPSDVKSSISYEYESGERHIDLLVLEYNNNSRAKISYDEMLREVEKRFGAKLADLIISKSLSSLLNSIGAIAWLDNFRPNIHFPVSSFCVSYELDEQNLVGQARASRFGETIYNLNK